MKHYEQQGEFRGLWVRTARTLRAGGYATRKEVLDAVRAEKLKPHLSLRDYGRYAHQEVVFWLGKKHKEPGRIPRIPPRIWDTVRVVFTTDEAVAKWFTSAERYLDGQAPCDFLKTKTGRTKVLNLALAMVHGVPL